jgi:uncharacterized membrane protein
MRQVGFAMLVLLSFAIAAYAIAMYGFQPIGIAVGPEMREKFAAHRLLVYAHVFSAALTLTAGPLQFSTWLRNKHTALHRWSGRIYLGIGVAIGGVAGFYMALIAEGGPVSRLGFATLALAWLYTGYKAWRAIRRRNLASHRRWMVRNYSLAFAAVTLRLWLPAGLLAGIPYEIVYPVVAWLSWLPNLILAEVWFNQAPGPAGKRLIAPIAKP